MNISEMLARNSRMYPQEIALAECIFSDANGFSKREITWRQFDENANKIANALKGRGIKKGDKVLHLGYNSIEWLLAYFGIIRSGAWVVPLNFRYTSDDIAYCASASEAKTLIFGQEFVEKVDAAHPNLPLVKDFIIIGERESHRAENFNDLLSTASSGPPETIVKDEDVCGLYFTSGTTGTPKPLLLTHRNMACSAITNCVHDHKQHDDNFVFLSPLYHTGSKMRWFGNLIVGSRGTMLTGVSPVNIFQVMSEEKGTTLMMLVPWALDILEALDRGELNLPDYDLTSWRLVTFGAQPVPPSLVSRWKKSFPKVALDIGYGLSESTGTGCVHLGTENWRKAASIRDIKGVIIGKAGFDWEARVVNEEGLDVSTGEVGELVVRGDGVMKGYYRNPDKTSETIKDGWLYTGDLAKMDSEGFIYLVDRKKDVIISGGENIYPVEIEDILHGHPMIKDVAVIGLPDKRLGEIVAAVIELQHGMILAEKEVFCFSEENLPRYKRPRRVIFDAVPRNPTGKLEKPKLREKYGGSKSYFKI